MSARVKLVFFGTESSDTNQHELECYLNHTNEEIYISINNKDDLHDPIGFICLDKSTAIKLSKSLRTEINKIVEVNHG